VNSHFEKKYSSIRETLLKNCEARFFFILDYYFFYRKIGIFGLKKSFPLKEKNSLPKKKIFKSLFSEYVLSIS